MHTLSDEEKERCKTGAELFEVLNKNSNLNMTKHYFHCSIASSLESTTKC